MSKKYNVDFKFDIKGLNALMKSDEMQEHLQEAAEAVAEASTYGKYGKMINEAIGAEVEHGLYGASVHVADFVAIAHVYPLDSVAALMANDMLRGISVVGLPMKKPHL